MLAKNLIQLRSREQEEADGGGSLVAVVEDDLFLLKIPHGVEENVVAKIDSHVVRSIQFFHQVLLTLDLQRHVGCHEVLDIMLEVVVPREVVVYVATPVARAQFRRAPPCVLLRVLVG